MLDWPITRGAFPVLILTIAVAALGWLLYGRGQTWWQRRVPIAAGCGVLAAVLTKLVVDVFWKPWPDPLPLVVLGAVVTTVAAATLLLLTRGSRNRRLVGVIAVIAVAVGSISQINAHFSAYSTLRQALGMRAANQVEFGRVGHPSTRPSTNGPTTGATPSSAAGMAAAGVVTRVPIPGVKSEHGG
jgi:hypothetical protein